MTFTMQQLLEAGGPQMHPRHIAKIQMDASVRVACKLLGGPEATFTMAELREAMDAIWGVTHDVRNFSREWVSTGYVRETGEKTQGLVGKPARIYAFTGQGLA